MSDFQATYSPEDNKLRLYAVSRLPSELYERLRAAGFSYAPKQALFVAPMWTPDREDLLLELCGSIDDETMTREERAAFRSERFAVYSDKRGAEAEHARETVAAITDHIPLGQPILVGHHSEKRARRDAERIECGMRKAVNLWETSNYWSSRAASVKRHASYLERADVRARRIKGIEADKRKQQRRKHEAELHLTMWTADEMTLERARQLAGTVFSFPVIHRDRSYWSAYDVLRPDGERYRDCPSMTPAAVVIAATQHFPPIIARCDRWIAHCDNRLVYEKAMLDDQGASDLLKKPERAKQPPLCNYRAPEGICVGRTTYAEPTTYAQVDMTSAEYARIDTNYKGTRVVGNSHRVRIAIVRGNLACVFLTDSKVHERPADLERRPVERPTPQRATDAPCHHTEEPSIFHAMKSQLTSGVKVVVAPQLFCSSKELARSIVRLVSPSGCSGLRILEPSAGTGVILDAIIDSATGADCCRTVAVEINAQLAGELLRRRDLRLDANDSNCRIICADFLACTPDELGLFDAIAMNPPFSENQATHHVEHALSFLKPGGRLGAVMPSGIRFREDRATRTLRRRLEDLGATFEDLPEGTFSAAGTQVNTVLVSLTQPY